VLLVATAFLVEAEQMSLLWPLVVALVAAVVAVA